MYCSNTNYIDSIDIIMNILILFVKIHFIIIYIPKVLYLPILFFVPIQQGRTSLHSACEKGHVDVVDFLLGHGADMLAKDEEQNSPLHVAVENKQTLVVQMLLEAGNPTNLENNVSTK